MPLDWGIKANAKKRCATGEGRREQWRDVCWQTALQESGGNLADFGDFVNAQLF